MRGGFPEALERRADDRREQWFASYLTTIVQRDLREEANIERLAEIPAVLASLALRVRAPLNKTATGAEVDFVLEGADGRLAGIEVKSSATVREEDFKQLKTMRDRIDDERFVRGVVLYTGRERLRFGERLEAWPVSALWSPQEQ